MQILRSCSPVSKEAVSPGQRNEYHGECHRNQTSESRTMKGVTRCDPDMKGNLGELQNHLAKAFGTVTSHKHPPSVLKGTTKLLKSKAVWGTNHISGLRQPRNISIQVLQFAEVCDTHFTQEIEYRNLPKQ